MEQSPLLPCTSMDQGESFKFLGVYISADLSWSVNISELVKKPQQRLFFLRVLKKEQLHPGLLVTFHSSTTESLLTYAVSAWYSFCTEADKRLQRVTNTAQKLIGCSLDSITIIYNSWCLSRARNILKDNTQPCFHLFNLFPSGRYYRSILAKANRLRDGFFPKAYTMVNSQC